MARDDDREREMDEEEQDRADDQSDAYESDEDYIEGGFDPEQRRFLWTLTGILVLGMLLASGANILYQSRERSHAQRLLVLEDEHDQARDRYEAVQRRNVDAMVRAYLAQNGSAVQSLMNELLDSYRVERETMAALRNARGLETPIPPDSMYREYGEFVFGRVREQASQIARSRGTTLPSTFPSSQPFEPTTLPASRPTP